MRRVIYALVITHTYKFECTARDLDYHSNDSILFNDYRNHNSFIRSLSSLGQLSYNANIFNL